MQIFINELSLQGQYSSNEMFTEAVRTFTAIFVLINEKIAKKQMYKDDLFLNREAIREEAFQASLYRIKDRSLREAFISIVFNKLNPKDWREERLHSEDDWFECKQHPDKLVTNTSLAEFAERSIQDPNLLGFLVNFSTSSFSTSAFTEVVKNEMDHVDLDCIEDKLSLAAWLEVKLRLSLVEYDYTSNVPPKDPQTILRDGIRFKPISRTVQGRKVYQDIQTGYYWYVDNLHGGNAAHLEVFDAQGRHLGEANLAGKLDTNKADAAKRLNVR